MKNLKRLAASAVAAVSLAGGVALATTGAASAQTLPHYPGQGTSVVRLDVSQGGRFGGGFTPVSPWQYPQYGYWYQQFPRDERPVGETVQFQTVRGHRGMRSILEVITYFFQGQGHHH